jgi:hypothetical protein
MLKNCQNLSKIVKIFQKLSKSLAGLLQNSHFGGEFECSFEKTKPIRRPPAGKPKLDNSGVFTGCLLPGVVPEILNPKKRLFSAVSAISEVNSEKQSQIADKPASPKGG